MDKRFPRASRRQQRGFSMVEMLMAAFVLAIGLLGLATLQVMSLKATRGGKSLNTAAQVAERVMDQIEMEGRLSWLTLTDSSYNAATAKIQVTALPLQYIGKNKVADGDYSQKLYFAFDDEGKAPEGSVVLTTKPAGRYVATVQATAPTSAGTTGTGNVSDFTVTIEFADQVAQTSQPITRTVTVTRRIIHG